MGVNEGLWNWNTNWQPKETIPSEPGFYWHFTHTSVGVSMKHIYDDDIEDLKLHVSRGGKVGYWSYPITPPRFPGVA